MMSTASPLPSEWALLEAEVNGRSFVGMRGVRDPEAPCDGTAGVRSVTIERVGVPEEYEITVSDYRTHAHHGGATLTEAINRAHKAWSSPPSSEEPK